MTNKYAADVAIATFKDEITTLPLPLLDDLVNHLTGASHVLGNAYTFFGVTSALEPKRRIDALAVVAAAEKRNRQH